MKHRTALSVVALLSLVILCAWLLNRRAEQEGFSAGVATGAQTLERLQLVWRDVQTMSEHDRRVLAYLAMRCRLHEEPMVAQNVVRCLERATTGAESAVHPAALARLLPPQHAISAEAQ